MISPEDNIAAKLFNTLPDARKSHAVGFMQFEFACRTLIRSVIANDELVQSRMFVQCHRYFGGV